MNIILFTKKEKKRFLPKKGGGGGKEKKRMRRTYVYVYSAVRVKRQIYLFIYFRTCFGI